MLATRTAFFSYRWSSDSHRDWVYRLAGALMGHGVRVILDQTHFAGEGDVALEIERSIAAADSVVLICTPDYKHSADNRIAGVGFETAVLAAGMLDSPRRGERIVPVLRSGSVDRSVPRYVSWRAPVDFRKATRFEEQVSVLVDVIRRGRRYGRGVVPRRHKRSRPCRWILVAGTGDRDRLPRDVESACADLGEGLAAKRGLGLVTGGWPGVDRAVAESFMQALDERGADCAEHLIEVVIEGDAPGHGGGRVVTVARVEDPLVEDGSSIESWIEPVKRADAIVLLGGKGGSYTTAEFGLMYGKPVLPLARSRGDARLLHAKMLEQWPRSRPGKLTRREFRSLDAPLPRAVPAALDLLDKL